MNPYYHPVWTARRPVLMFAGKPGLAAAFQGVGARSGIRSEERDPPGKLVGAQRHPATALVLRVMAAGAFVAALFAVIGRAIELALVL